MVVKTQSEVSINTSFQIYMQVIHVILWLTVQLGINYRRYNRVYLQGGYNYYEVKPSEITDLTSVVNCYVICYHILVLYVYTY